MSLHSVRRGALQGDWMDVHPAISRRHAAVRRQGPHDKVCLFQMFACLAAACMLPGLRTCKLCPLLVHETCPKACPYCCGLLHSAVQTSISLSEAGFFLWKLVEATLNHTQPAGGTTGRIGTL